MIEQLSFFAPARRHDGAPLKASYVQNRQERPADLPRLRESAETMQARVLEWFADRIVSPRSPIPPHRAIYWHKTPSDCAEGMGLPLTTVRPRICQLAKRTSGPRLEHCKWIKRRPTKAGSEGFYRYVPGEIVPAKEGNQ